MHHRPCTWPGYSYSIDGDITANHGGDDAWVVKVSGQTGISELQESKKSFFFPNPSNTFIRVTLFAKPSLLIIYDITGRIILEEEVVFAQQSIDISKFPSGVYVVELVNEGGRMINELVKE